ncbi:hypothetical protein OCU04_006044 [Sclerotinia nivalis]|uniref:Uncharacterized protein n=1 Tax=Sclerotinia nivalis TaxID=352851 RepID=A0A9X0DJ05_9HELO|nr:hypothetical protein OCU04_006044 [Sclerotinia nivalis]
MPSFAELLKKSSRTSSSDQFSPVRPARGLNELDFDNHKLPDGISNLSLNPISTSKAKSGREGAITNSSYCDLDLGHSNGNNGKFYASHHASEQRWQSEINDSDGTDKSHRPNLSAEIDLDSGRRGYLQSRRSDLSGIEEVEEEEELYTSEENPVEAFTALFDVDMENRLEKLQHNVSNVTLKDDDSDDRLELVDSRCALLAPSGTRWSATNLAEDNKQFSASDLIKRLTTLKKQQESEKGLRRRLMIKVNHGREDWRVLNRSKMGSSRSARKYMELRTKAEI